MKKVKGKKFEFPIYYDVEEPSVLETGSENLKNMINTFCGELEKIIIIVEFMLHLMYS